MPRLRRLPQQSLVATLKRLVSVKLADPTFHPSDQLVPSNEGQNDVPSAKTTLV